MTHRIFESETKKCECGHQIKSWEHKCSKCGKPVKREKLKNLESHPHG